MMYMLKNVRYLMMVLVLMPAITYGQLAYRELSPEAKRIRYAYDELVKVPHSSVTQLTFIQVFPATRDAFINILNPDTQDELTDIGADVVKHFREVGKDWPDSVLRKSILIAKDLNVWSKGPAGELQKTIYLLTSEHPFIFINAVNELKSNEQAALGGFLSSGKDGTNKNFDALVDLLERAGEKKMVKRFKEGAAALKE